MKKTIYIFDKIDSFMFLIAQIAVFVLMIVTMADVVMRYLFNSSIVIALTLSEDYLMVIIVFFSMSYVMKMNGHIKLDLFLKYLPDKSIKYLNCIYLLLAAGIMFFIGYEAMNATYDAYIQNFKSAGLVQWPTWLSWVWIPIGSFVFSIRLILYAITPFFGIELKESIE